MFFHNAIPGFSRIGLRQIIQQKNVSLRWGETSKGEHHKRDSALPQGWGVFHLLQGRKKIVPVFPARNTEAKLGFVTLFVFFSKILRFEVPLLI